MWILSYSNTQRKGHKWHLPLQRRKCLDCQGVDGVLHFFRQDGINFLVPLNTRQPLKYIGHHGDTKMGFSAGLGARMTGMPAGFIDDLQPFRF